MADDVIVAGQETAVLAAEPVVADLVQEIQPDVAPVTPPVAEAPAPPVAAPPIPAVPDPQIQATQALRQAYARQAEQNRQYELALRNQQMADELAKFEQTLLATYAPEHVAPLVNQRREMYLQQFAVQDQVKDQAAKGQMIQRLSTEYGAPAQLLSQYNEPQAMHQAAMGYKLQQENAALKAEIAKMKQAAVPPAAKGLPGTVSRGGETVTADNIDALYNQGKVSAALYRSFLSTGQIR